MRPYYEHGGITIYHGDCRQILPLLGRFDLLLTDPPFDFRSYPTDVAPDIRLITSAAATWAIWGYPELLCQWCLTLGRAPDEWITWWPSNAAAKAGGRHADVPRQIECVAIFGDALFADRVRAPRARLGERIVGVERSPTVRAGDVWRDASPGVAFNAPLRLHPNEKPVSVMGKLLDLCAAPGATIIDPYMGSGPIAKAAKDRGLKYVGIELVGKHCESAVRRLAQGVLFGDPS